MYDKRKVNFYDELCTVKYGKYKNGRTAIELICEDGEPMIMATVNVVDYQDLNDNEVIIKDYSENEGVLKALIKAGIITTALKNIPTGFVNVQVCEFTPQYIED